MRGNQRVLGAKQELLESFNGGLYEVVPQDRIKTFTDKELEEVICGYETIDLDE